jgi:hypothetical protein
MLPNAERSPRREGSAQDAATSAPSVQRDLDIAQDLAAAGIPVFVAYPDPDKPGEYRPPKGWQNTTANPAYVGAWRPGRALCAVMGRGLDLVDIDPRNGGDPAALRGLLPEVLGVAASPSGGEHRFVPSMGVRSRDGVLPGIDVKAGDPEGQGRGFAFIAPTVRVSKTTGERAAYRWVKPPDLTRLNGGGEDGRLATLVRRAHGSHKQPTDGTASFHQPAPSGWDKHTGPVKEGEHHRALISYAGWMREQGIPLRPFAEALMRLRLADLVPGAAAIYTEAEAFAELHDVYSRYEAGDPAPSPADDDLAEIAAAFTPVDWHAAWAAKPDEIQWLIEPLIEAGQSVAVYATPGTGKSLLALELGAALATGRPVLGNPPREPVTVVYIDVENRQSSLVERLQAYRYEPGNLGRLVLFSFPSIAALDSLAGGQQILALAVTHQATIVIIDTTSRVVAGKENDADTYLAFYRHTIIPLRARGIAMLRLDHPGKDVSRGTRGSSAKKGDVDAEWLLTKLSENTFGLDRQKERENHGDAHLALRRSAEPLRHEVTSGSGDRAGELAAELDRLNVPPGTGRVIAAKALRDAGIKVRGTDLAEALRRRNAIPCQPPITPSPSDSQSVGTARNRPVRGDPAGDGSHHPHSGGNREPSPVPDAERAAVALLEGKLGAQVIAWPEGSHGEEANQ